VNGEVEGLKYEVGFVLFLAEGAISTLECFNYGDETFPENAILKRAYYVTESGKKAGKLTLLGETNVRDIGWMLGKKGLSDTKH
jgi:hypothetical protein